MAGNESRTGSVVARTPAAPVVGAAATILLRVTEADTAAAKVLGSRRAGPWFELATA